MLFSSFHSQAILILNCGKSPEKYEFLITMPAISDAGDSQMTTGETLSPAHENKETSSLFSWVVIISFHKVFWFKTEMLWPHAEKAPDKMFM